MGHRIVGEIADQHLCTETRLQVEALLDDGETLGSAGLWADRIRDQREWSHTGPWHYINVPDGGSPARLARVSPHNVLAALERQEAELLNRRLARGRRATALRFVVHLVADIHQPLHVGRAEDRGGNRIPVSMEGKVMDLHGFWDAQALLAQGGLKARDQARSLEGLVVGTRAPSRPGPAGQEHPWQASEPMAWAAESMALRPLVYGFRPRKDQPASLSRAYQAGARNTVNLRLAQAGVRLAGRLNRLGCGPVSPPR